MSTTSYFNAHHPLAETAADRCDHQNRHHYGRLACGQCWEAAIRDDAATGDPLDQTMIDAALAGHHVTLGPGERREVIDRLTQRGETAARIAARLGVTTRTVVRARANARPTNGAPHPAGAA